MRVVLAAVLLLVGTGLIAVTAVGLIRLPDVYNRMNAVAKAASLGLSCVLLGCLTLLPGLRGAVVIGVAILLQLATAPIGGYALARAAYQAGSPLAVITHQDQLAQRRSAGPGGGSGRVGRGAGRIRSGG